MVQENQLFLFLKILTLTFFVAFYGLLSFPVHAADPKPPIEVLALHAQRYQDHAANKIRCEIFGEIKNISDRPLKSVSVTLEFFDEKGKKIASEDDFLTLRVIQKRKPKGVARPVKPNEIGVFIQDTQNCPPSWLEGRIKYKIKTVEWE